MKLLHYPSPGACAAHRVPAWHVLAARCWVSLHHPVPYGCALHVLHVSVDGEESVSSVSEAGESGDEAGPGDGCGAAGGGDEEKGFFFPGVPGGEAGNATTEPKIHSHRPPR